MIAHPGITTRFRMRNYRCVGFQLNAQIAMFRHNGAVCLVNGLHQHHSHGLFTVAKEVSLDSPAADALLAQCNLTPAAAREMAEWL